MSWQFTPYTWPLALIAAICGLLAIPIWRRRTSPGGRPAVVILLGAMLYSGGYALELASTSLGAMRFWGALQWVGIVTLPTAVFGFALAYTGHGYWWDRRKALLAAIVPAATLLLRWTNSWHHLVHATAVVDRSLGFALQRVTYGPAWWAAGAYHYALLAASLLLLLRMWARSFRLYWLQVSVLLLGMLGPWVANLLYVMRLSPWPGLDLTPLGFGITALTIAWSLFGLHWLDIAPLARTAVIQDLADAVIVVDVQGRVAELNPAAADLFATTVSAATGQAPEDVCGACPELVGRLKSGAATGAPVTLVRGNVARAFDAHISPLRDWRGRIVGRSVVLRDITERFEAEAALLQGREHFRNLIENALDLIVVFNPDGSVHYASPSMKPLLGYEPEAMIGKDGLTAFHHEDAAKVRQLHVRALEEPDRAQSAEVRIRHANGDWHVLEAVGRALREGGQVTGVVVNARDITERRRAGAHSRQRAEQLAALQATVLDLTGLRDLPGLLQAIVERAARLLDAPGGELYVCEPENQRVRSVVNYNTVRDYTGSTLKYGEGAAGSVAQTGQPLIIENYHAWPQRADVYDRDMTYHIVLSVPLIWQGQTIGVVNLLRGDGMQPFAQADAELLALFANHAAIAVANARLYDAAQQELQQRQRTQEELRQLKEFSEGIVQGMAEALILEDERGLIVFVNPATEKLLGCSSAELLGKHWQCVVAPDQVAMIEDKTARRPAGFADQYETRLVRHDGRQIPVLINARPRFKDEGFAGVLSACTDITEQKRAEEQVRQARDRAQQYLDVAEVMLVALDREGKITLMNASGCRILGYKEAELLGRDWFDTCLPVNIRHSVRLVFHKLMAQDARPPEYYENTVLTNRGDERIIAWRNALLTDAEGNAMGTLSSGVDITERKQAEQALRESEERFRIAAQSASDLIYEWNMRTDEVRWFGDIEGRLGYAPGEIPATYQGWRDLLHPDDRKRDQAAVESHLLTHEPYSGEFRVVTRDGQVRYWTDRGTAVWDERGTPLRWVGVTSDITARKLAEEQRETLEAQLRHSQKMEAVGLLAGGVAHDFNNLLTVVLGNTELGLAQVQAKLAPERELLAIQRTGKRAAALTQQLLAFSRQQILQAQVLDLNELIRGFAAAYGKAIGVQVEMQLDLQQGLSPVKADAGAIEQVLMNLALNARDAMPEGGALNLTTTRVSVDAEHVKTHPDARSGDFVRLSVADSGVGMDAETLRHVFEPFFTTKDVGKGTGLGLSVVYGIVTQHQGWIEVSSQPGQGTCFDIYLPPYGGSEAAAVSEQAAAVRTGSEIILLAEDEPAVLDLARTILEHAGYRVLAATDGEQAVKLFAESKERVDLLLMDAMMPRMSGGQAYEAMHALRADVPVLFITGYSPEAARSRLVQGAGLPLLQKPFDIDQLLRAVRVTLDQRKRT